MDDMNNPDDLARERDCYSQANCFSEDLCNGIYEVKASNWVKHE